MNATASATPSPGVAPMPLGPDSMTWQYFGQLAGFAIGPVPQLLQVMHPVLGHAVDQHSNVKVDPFDRLLRSMGPIYGVIYDGPEASGTARAVRGYHEGIKGELPDGTRYSALNPEVFHWAHATFVNSLLYHFGSLLGPFSREDQEQLYAESQQWYSLYGMTMRNVPETVDEFDEYFDHYVNDELELTPAAEWLLRTFRAAPNPSTLSWIPRPVTAPVARLGGQAVVTYAAGLLPPAARNKLGLRWNRIDQVEYEAIRRTLRTTVLATPAALRYHPRALAGWRREAEARGVSVSELITMKD